MRCAPGILAQAAIQPEIDDEDDDEYEYDLPARGELRA